MCPRRVEGSSNSRTLFACAGLADPYALIQVLPQDPRNKTKPKKTATKYKTLDPVYNQDFELYVDVSLNPKHG